MNIAVIISHYTSFLMNVIIESSSAQLVRFPFWVDRLINATLMIAALSGHMGTSSWKEVGSGHIAA